MPTSILKLSTTNTATTNNLPVADYFTPYDQATLAAQDIDLGSCGPLLLPDSVGSVAHPHLLVGVGKSGKIYLLDRDNMGHWHSGSDSQIVRILHRHQWLVESAGVLEQSALLSSRAPRR